MSFYNQLKLVRDGRLGELGVLGSEELQITLNLGIYCSFSVVIHHCNWCISSNLQNSEAKKRNDDKDMDLVRAPYHCKFGFTDLAFLATCLLRVTVDTVKRSYCHISCIFRCLALDFRALLPKSCGKFRIDFQCRLRR